MDLIDPQRLNNLIAKQKILTSYLSYDGPRSSIFQYAKVTPKDQLKNAVFHYIEAKDDFVFTPAEEDDLEKFSEIDYDNKPLHIEGNILTYYPMRFETYRLNELERQSIYLNKATNAVLFNNQYIVDETEQMRAFETELQEYMIKKSSDFSSADKLVDVLQKIPNFKIKLTPEQVGVVGTNGNVLVIGRSGTGKTTCAVLRMFAMELLFKYRMKIFINRNLQQVLQTSDFSSADYDNMKSLKIVFVTASPVLSTEIMRYYERLTTQIKAELKKKDQIRLKRKKEELLKKKEELANQSKQQLEEQSKQEIQQVQESDIQTLKVENMDDNFMVEDEIEKELMDIKLQEELDEETLREKDQQIQYEKMMKGEDYDSQMITEKLKNYTTLLAMGDRDFPAFLSLRSLIMLIDASLIYPFFARTYDNKIKDSGFTAQWHGENKGKLFINNHHKMDIKDGADQLTEDDFSKIEQESAYMTTRDHFPEVNDDKSNFFLQKQLEFEEKQFQNKHLERHKMGPQKNRNYYDNSSKASFEIDYDYFALNFWPRVEKGFYNFNGCSALFLWTEFYSYIKGSAECYKYYNYSINKNDYTASRKHLSKAYVEKIYESFLAYEQWKYEERGYDLMDVVNYLIKCIKGNSYYLNRNLKQFLDYMMIDEVQDMPQNVIYLLKLITKQGLFFSGDTAQNIAKGLGFRFAELRTLFSDRTVFEEIVEIPKVKQLSVNFRSHNQILVLANSVVNLIEIFFPQTIDVLRKERSNIDGPKPIILMDQSTEFLFKFLSGVETKLAEEDENQKVNEDQGFTSRKQQLEFGCNQVIIVRDQESKDKLPKILSHALCLTIYEAQGLEFDDVILYNFFSDQTSVQQQSWTSVMHHLLFDELIMTKDEYEKETTQHEKEIDQKFLQEKMELEIVVDEEGKQEFQQGKNQEEESKVNLSDKFEQEDDEDDEIERIKAPERTRMFNNFADEKDIVKIQKPYKNPITSRHLDVNKFSEVCTELQLLYVAITRPRNRLIIFDEEKANRAPMQEYWKQMSAVKFVYQEEFEKERNEMVHLESEKPAIILTNSDQKDWKSQGIKMLKLRYYAQALICFERAGETELYKRTQMNYLADKAQNTIELVERDRMFMSQNINMKNTKGPLIGAKEYKQLQKAEETRLNLLQQEALDEFAEVGVIFGEMGQFRKAGQCFFSAQRFQEAFEMFEKANLPKQAGESLFLLKDYQRAGIFFDESGEHLRAIECLDAAGEWEQILEVLNKNKSKFSQREHDAFIKRYAPLAFEKIMSSFTLAQQIPASSDDPVPQQIIQEEDEEDEDESDEEDEKEKKSDDDEQQADNQGEEGEQIQETDDQNNEKDGEKLIENDVEIDEFGDRVIKKSQKPQVTQIEENKASGKDIMEISFTEKSLVHEQNKEILEWSVRSAKEKKQKDESLMDNMSFDNLSSRSSSKDVTKILGQKTVNEDRYLDEDAVKSLGSMSFEFADNKLQTFDHLAHFDPDDEWLQFEKGSIIESIYSARKSGIKPMSEYSIIEGNFEGDDNEGETDSKISFSINSQLIRTQTDIFIQDDTMKRIINLMRMFSDNFKKETQKIRSKSILLTKQVEKEETKEIIEVAEQDDMTDFIIDLDKIDQNFILIILDTLEYFNAFKLCIFVCNRYKLSKKVGRYVVDIAHQFSQIAQSESILTNQVLLRPSTQRQMKLEEGIISHIALHHVLENINPEFLRLKNSDQKLTDNNNLGFECFRGLIWLGYWKKVLFMMDYQNSLMLAALFADFRNFKLIFLSKNPAYNKDNARIRRVIQEEQPTFECIPFMDRAPKNKFELNAAIVSIEHFVWENLFKTQFFNQNFLSILFQKGEILKPKEDRDQKQNDKKQKQKELLNEQSQILDESLVREKLPQFPSFFEYNQSLWKFMYEIYSEENCREVAKNIGKSSELLRELRLNIGKINNSEEYYIKIYDSALFLMLVLFLSKDESNSLSKAFNLASAYDMNNFFDGIQLLIQVCEKGSIINPINLIIRKAIILPFLCRETESNYLTDMITADQLVIHRASSIIEEIFRVRYQDEMKQQQMVNRFETERQIHDRKLKQIQESFDKMKKKYVNEKQIQKDRFQQHVDMIANLELQKQQQLKLRKELEFNFNNAKSLFMNESMFFIDLEYNFISISSTLALRFIENKTSERLIEVMKKQILSGKNTPFLIDSREALEAKLVNLTNNYSLQMCVQEVEQIKEQKEEALQKLINFSPVVKQPNILEQKNNKNQTIPGYKLLNHGDPLYQITKMEFQLQKQRERSQYQDSDDEVNEYINKEYGLTGGKQKPNIMVTKQIKKQIIDALTWLNGSVDSKIQEMINPIAKGFIIKKALSYFKKGRFQSKAAFNGQKLIKCKYLLTLVGHEEIFEECMRKVIKENNFYNFVVLQDTDLFKKHNLTQNYLESHYEYIEGMWNEIEIAEQINRLQEIMIHALVSFNLAKMAKEKKQESLFSITNNYMRYMGQLKNPINYNSLVNESMMMAENDGYTEKDQKSVEILELDSLMPFSQIDTPVYIEKLLSIIKRLLGDNEVFLQQKTVYIYYMMMTVVLNFTDMDKNQFNTIQEIFSMIDLDDSIHDRFRNDDIWIELTHLESKEHLIDLTADLVYDAKLFITPALHSVKLDGHFKVVDIYFTQITNEQKETQIMERNTRKNTQELCRRLLNKRNISQYYTNNYNQIKQRYNKLATSEKVYLVLSDAMFKDFGQIALYNLLIDKSTLFENLLKYFILSFDFQQFYYVNLVNNSLDFHYLIINMENLWKGFNDIKLCFSSIIKGNGPQGEHLNQIVAIRKEFELLFKSFQDWKLVQNKNEDVSQIALTELVKKTHLAIALKWAQRGRIVEAKQIMDQNPLEHSKNLLQKIQ